MKDAQRRVSEQMGGTPAVPGTPGAPAAPGKPPTGPTKALRPGEAIEQKGSDGKMHKFIFRGGDPKDPKNYRMLDTEPGLGILPNAPTPPALLPGMLGR